MLRAAWTVLDEIAAAGGDGLAGHLDEVLTRLPDEPGPEERP